MNKASQALAESLPKDVVRDLELLKTDSQHKGLAGMLVRYIEQYALQPAISIELVAIVALHKAMPKHVMDLVKQFGLSMAQVATLYDVQRQVSTDKDSLNLVQLAGLNQAFPDEGLLDDDTAMLDLVEKIRQHADILTDSLFVSEAIKAFLVKGSELLAEGEISVLSSNGIFDAIDVLVEE